MPSYRYSLLILCIGVVLSSPLRADPFEDFLRQALQRNHGLQAEFQNWQARVNSADASGFLPEPMITYDYYFKPDEPKDGPQSQELMLEQRLPWFGVRGLQKSARQQQAEAGYWQWQARRLELQMQAGDLYADLFYWQQALAISQKNLALLQELEAIARARYRVATTSHPDLIRIQLEVGKATDELLSLEQQKPSLQARIATLLSDRSGAQSVPWPERLPDIPALDSAALDTQIQQHPMLQQQTSLLRNAETAVALADKRYGPEVTLRYGHMFVNESTDPMMKDGDNFPEYVGIAVSAPIWFSQYDALKKAAHSRVLSAQDSQAFLQDQLTAQVHQAEFQLRDSRRKLTLYQDDLIPRAEESLQAQLRAYQTGQTTFLELLDAEKLLLELQLLAVKSQADQWKAYHALLLASGRFYRTDLAGGAP
jgi:outer membrane protein TolC